MTTILYHGFRIMFAVMILAFSGAAILLAIGWVALTIYDGNLSLYPHPAPSIAAREATALPVLSERPPTTKRTKWDDLEDAGEAILSANRAVQERR
jgi:hypothetical protein